MKNFRLILFLLLYIFSFEAKGQVPTATFTATANPVCACSNATFTNTYTNAPTSWTWYFPGGTPSYTTITTSPGNPGPINYCTRGFYMVSLVVSNISGSDSVANPLTVDSLPVITINPPSGGICDVSGGNAFDTINFMATASANSTFSWAPPTGLSCTNCSNPRAYPSVTTVYTVTATSASGCTSTKTDTVYADSIVASIRGIDTICPGQPDTLIASGGSNNITLPETYNWSTGQTTSAIVVSPTSTTTYSCMITSGAAGCHSSAAFTVFTSCITGINSVLNPDEFEIYPNPATSKLTIVTEKPYNTPTSFAIIDFTGRELLRESMNPSQTQFELNVSSLAEGMYFIQVKTKDSVNLIKFIKN
jgi:PKD repeat protein